MVYISLGSEFKFKTLKLFGYSFNAMFMHVCDLHIESLVAWCMELREINIAPVLKSICMDLSLYGPSISLA
jgi:hypothetical protein